MLDHVYMVSFALYSAQGLEFNEPSSYEEAITCSDSEKWKFDMLEEMKSLEKNQTWDLIPKLAG